jgi:hypothetical protein
MGNKNRGSSRTRSLVPCPKQSLVVHTIGCWIIDAKAGPTKLQLGEQCKHTAVKPDEEHSAAGARSKNATQGQVNAKEKAQKKCALINAGGKPTEVDKVKKRKLNVVYARRRREKERIEIEVLQDQCLQLNTKNNSVEDENSRLEKLLQDAIQVVDRHEHAVATTLPSSSPLLLPNHTSSSAASSSPGAVYEAELVQFLMKQMQQHQRRSTSNRSPCPVRPCGRHPPAPLCEH